MTRAELIEERKKARAALNPRAFKACQSISHILRVALPVLSVSLFGIGFLLLVMFSSSKNSIGSQVIATLVGAVVGSFLLMMAARMVLVALYFFRYSMADLLYFLLSINAMATLISLFPSDLKFIPVIGLLYVAAMPISYFLAQDPEGDNFLPDFVRRDMIEKRAKARQHGATGSLLSTSSHDIATESFSSAV